MANNSKPENERVKAISATTTKEVEEKVRVVSIKKGWSLAKTAGYFIQRGLDADKEFQKAA